MAVGPITTVNDCTPFLKRHAVCCISGRIYPIVGTCPIFAVLEAVGHESLAAAARYEREGNGEAAKLYRDRNDALLVAADAIRDKLERENRNP